MKLCLIICFIVLFFAGSAFSQGVPPIVTNVKAVQNPDTRKVDVTYDVNDADSDTLFIILLFSDDDGVTYEIAPSSSSLDSAVGWPVEDGDSLKIVWDIMNDYYNQKSSEFKAKVIAYDERIIVNEGHGDYVLVPAGEFLMGDPYNSGSPEERPAHLIYLDKYYIGRYEVTNGEYIKFIDDGGYTNSDFWVDGGFGVFGSTPSNWFNQSFRGGGIPKNEDYPVTGISWYEATAYCRWLSDKTKKIYRLPTEAEWEKAAKGTNQTFIYPFGTSITSAYLNYRRSNDFGPLKAGYYNGTIREGFKTRNGSSMYWAHDMAGNVSEFCKDIFDKGYYGRSVYRNPQGGLTGIYITLRGGSWVSAESGTRVTFREYVSPVSRRDFYGFRCVQSDLQAEVTLSDNGLQFENVVGGQSSNKNFTITNDGNLDLLVRNISSNNTAYTLSTDSGTVRINEDLQVAVTFTPTKIGVDSALITVTSTDRDEIESTVLVKGIGLFSDIRLTDTTLVIPAVTGRSSGTGSFYINNDGNYNLAVSSITSSDSNFTVNPSSSISISENGSSSINVTFTPVRPGADSTELTLTSNDLDEAERKVFVSGYSNSSEISASISTITFPDSVAVSSTRDSIFKIFNTGNLELNVNKIESSDSAFSVSPVSATAAENDTITATVTFAPDTAGLFEAQLKISSDAVNSDTLRINVTGYGKN